MEELKELLDRLREKLQYTRRLTEEYDHAMDFASYCTMQGLVEGIEFAIEEIEELLKEKSQGARVPGPGKTKRQGKDSSKGAGKGAGKGEDKNKPIVKARTKAEVRIGVKGKKG
jgi:hypothetical protein